MLWTVWQHGLIIPSAMYAICKQLHSVAMKGVRAQSCGAGSRHVGTCCHNDGTTGLQPAISALDVHELLQPYISPKTCLQSMKQVSSCSSLLRHLHNLWRRHMCAHNSGCNSFWICATAATWSSLVLHAFSQCSHAWVARSLRFGGQGMGGEGSRLPQSQQSHPCRQASAQSCQQ